MVTRAEMLAALASELVRIEGALTESQGWLHEGLCDCEQCLYELRKQRKLCDARQRVLAEMAELERRAHDHEAAGCERAG